MRDERTTNYYTVLELLPTATLVDIKKAWHEQLQVWHPDRFNHSPALHRKAEARTQLINQAYQTLSDPTLRIRYDAATQNAPSTTPPHVRLLSRVCNQIRSKHPTLPARARQPSGPHGKGGTRGTE